MSPAQTTETPLAGRPDFEKLLYDFDKAWRRGLAPRMEGFLPPAAEPDPARRQCVAELAKIDLEYRWRRAKPGDTAPPRLEEYVAGYPELAPVTLELIVEEYRARQRWGDRPRHEEYEERFPLHADLSDALQRIDHELAGEADREGSPGTVLVPEAAVPRDGGSAVLPSWAAVVQALRDHQLLSLSQLSELLPDAEPRQLGKELLQRGWLTPYQVNRLLQGRGAELVLGPYVLLERLGEGGAGQVFKARHQRMKRVVALKVIREELLAEAEVVGRFAREIQVVSQLSHANVVRAYDAGQAGATHYLVMEFVEGIDLSRLVKASGPLPAAQACDYARQAALGLQHIHEHGLVHRDLKPSNLLLDRRREPAAVRSVPAPPWGLVRILDLGLARLCCKDGAEINAALAAEQSLGTLTPAGALMMGTPDYLAPEQALDFHQADTRADIYSLGCTLYYLLTGRPPFPGGTLAQKLLKHQQNLPPLEQLPPAVAAVLRKLLAKRPEERFQTPAEAATALSSLVDGGPVAETAVNPASTASPPLALPSGGPPPGSSATAPLALSPVPVGSISRSSPWRGTWLLLGGVGGLTLAVLLALLLSSRGTQRPSTQAAVAGGFDLHLLDSSRIPTEERFADQPSELVAVLGEHRGRHWGPMWRAAYTPDGRIIATPGYDRVVRLWDADTLREQGIVRGLGTEATSVAVSHDGATLAVGGLDGSLRLVDLKTRQVKMTLAGHTSTVLFLAFSSDRRLLASAGRHDKMAKIWDLTTGKIWEDITGFTGPVYCLAFAPDGKSLAFAGSELALIDPQQKKQLALTKDAHKGPVVFVAFHPDGTILGSAGVDGFVRLWNMTEEPRGARHSLPHGAGVSVVTFSPDRKTLATATQVRSAIRLWEVDSGKPLGVFDGVRGDVYHLTFSPDGKTLASVSNDAQLRTWDVATRRPRRASKGHTGGVLSVAFSGRGHTFASAGADGRIILWDLPSGQERRALHTGLVWEADFRVTRMSVSPDGQLVAAGVKNTGACVPQVWDTATGQQRRSFKGEHSDAIYSAVFSPDGRALATGSRDGSVKLWDLASGAVQHTLLGHRPECKFLGVAFSPDGKLLASVDERDGNLKVWDTATGVEKYARRHGGEAIYAAAFSPDGQWLATGGGSDDVNHGTIRIWDAASGAPRHILAGHRGIVTSVAFSPDGKLLASSCSDGMVRLWDPAGGHLQRTIVLTPDFGYIGEVAFSPDGQHLATANGNGTVYILRLPTPPAGGG